MKKLLQYNIKTALDLANADHCWVRKVFNIVLARTALELKGTPCLSLEDTAPRKKTLISSRSFGTPITNPEHLREAVSMHASLLAGKLRSQGSKTSLMNVYIRTNPFDPRGAYYSNSCLVSLVIPSQDSAVLIKASTAALQKIYRPGLSYKKAGVTVLNLTPETQCTASLFKEWEEKDSAKRKTLLKTMDRLNKQYGRGSLIFASEGVRRSWRPKSGWRSPSYTQDWTTLVEVRLEKAEILPSVKEWQDMRSFRNRLTHEYPRNPELVVKNLNASLTYVKKLLGYWKFLRIQAIQI